MLTTPVIAIGSTFVRPTDKALIDRTPLIVKATVLSKEESQLPAGGPRTDHLIRVERVLKGFVPGSVLNVSIPGGKTSEGAWLKFWGAPQLSVGGQVLLLLSPRSDGSYGVDQLALGAYHEIDVAGRHFLIRNLNELFELREGDTLTYQEQKGSDSPRDAESFLNWIEQTVEDRSPTADYYSHVSATELQAVKKQLLVYESTRGAPLAGPVMGSVEVTPAAKVTEQESDFPSRPTAGFRPPPFECQSAGIVSVSVTKHYAAPDDSNEMVAFPILYREVIQAEGTDCVRVPLETASTLEPLLEYEILQGRHALTTLTSNGSAHTPADPGTSASSSAKYVDPFLTATGPQVTSRGYQPQSCSFDMDDDFIYGEPGDDCNVCDGVTTDPDSDGIAEDLIYVSASSGNDSSSCGASGAPCRTINYAVNTRADGPGDGAEDIICIKGNFSSEPAGGIFFPHGGVAGTKTRTKSGSEVRDFEYPKNPLMIVGWDADNDGSYPPFDTDDTAVIDGGQARRLVFNNSSAKHYIEVAHLSVEDYGSATLDGSTHSGLWRSSNGSSANYSYLHDLEMLRVNKGRCVTTGAVTIQHAKYNHFAFENIKCDECGGFYMRGGIDANATYGPIRMKNLTLKCFSCGAAANGGNARCRINDSWGGTRGWEWLDSFFDYNPDAWDENGGAGTGITQTQCLQDLDIVNNEFKDFSGPVGVEFADDSFCNPGVPTADLRVDRNVHYIVSNVAWGSPTFVNLVRDGTEGSNRLSGDMIITNNLAYSANGQRYSAFFYAPTGIGNNETPQDATVTVANNTMVVDTWGQFNEAFAKISNPNTTYKQQHFSFLNNVVVGAVESDSNNMIVEYAPVSWTSDFNVFVPGNGYVWNGTQRNNLANWIAATGGGANSTECIPVFEEPGTEDFHLSAGDVCAKDTGVSLSGQFQHDLDMDSRGQGSGWDRGADEVNESNPGFYNLTVSRSGTGSGTVTSSPAGINCGSDCTEQYADGAQVNLTATPSAGSLFAGWSGSSDCSDGQVTMTGSRSCTASFSLNTAPTVTITAPVTNLSLGATVTSSGNEFPASGSEHIVDGVVDMPQSAWAASGAPNWVEIDLGAEHVVDRLKIAPFTGSPGSSYFYDNAWQVQHRNSLGGRSRDFTGVIKLSGAGTHIAPGVSISNGDPGSTSSMAAYKSYELEFDPVVVRYLKLTISEGDRDGDSNGAEIEVRKVFPAGSPVTFRGSSSDPQQGNLSEEIVWTSDRDGLIGSGSVLTTTSLSTGSHTIVATVTDSGGLQASVTEQIRVVVDDPKYPRFSDGFEGGDSAAWSSTVL